MRLWAAVLMSGMIAAGAVAQVPSGQVPVAPSRTNMKTDAQLDQEAKKADALYQQNHLLDALPLYAELHEQRPKRVFYTERLAMAYVMKSGAAGTPEEKTAAREYARKLLAEAKAAGDTSDLLQIASDQLDQAATQPGSKGPRPAGSDTLDQAEALFSKGDLKGAMELYTKAWQENPTLYMAPLFAGDAEYKQGHYDEAGVWFQRAIAIDPDRETAHRYWADDLAKAGRAAEARKEFVAAFVAEPYARAPRLVLKTWAGQNGLRYVPPPVQLPASPNTGKDGHIEITLDGSKQNDALAPSYLMYSMNSALWQGEKFKKEFPKEKVYRHSLAEEVDTLHLLLVSVREQKIPEGKYDASIRTLLALEKDGMLECWILLDNPDQGIAQDYAAYRANHRDLLKAYVDKYDLHAA